MLLLLFLKLLSNLGLFLLFLPVQSAQQFIDFIHFLKESAFVSLISFVFLVSTSLIFTLILTVSFSFAYFGIHLLFFF